MHPHPRAAILAATLVLGTVAASRPAAGPATLQPAPTNAVVLVVSSAGRDSGRTRPGFEMDELAQAYLILKRNGYRVTIASPSGGPVEADRFDATSDYNAAFLADAEGVAALARTRPTAGLRAFEFDAVVVIGGKGAMLDLPTDTALARFAGEMFDRGNVVSAVCHGPAGLVRARTRDGKPLFAGRAVTGFSNEEEKIFGKKWSASYDFWLEDEARRVGARWEEAPLMLPHVAVDGRLITGQNPFATSEAMETVVRTLGRTPVARAPWKDERAVYAAASLLREPQLVAQRQLAAQHQDIATEFIGLIGYYQLDVAESTADVERAIRLMELASPYMPQPEISLGLAKGYHRVGRAAEARQLVDAVAASHPQMASAARAILSPTTP